jgi:hypothetical protein
MDSTDSVPKIRRSERAPKPVVRYEPMEVVTDDYSDCSEDEDDEEDENELDDIEEEDEDDESESLASDVADGFVPGRNEKYETDSFVADDDDDLEYVDEEEEEDDEEEYIDSDETPSDEDEEEEIERLKNKLRKLQKKNKNQQKPKKAPANMSASIVLAEFTTPTKTNLSESVGMVIDPIEPSDKIKNLP